MKITAQKKYPENDLLFFVFLPNLDRSEATRSGMKGDLLLDLLLDLRDLLEALPYMIGRIP